MSQTPDPGGLLDALNNAIGGAATALLAAMIGRGMWHARQVSEGRRPLVSWALVWELLMAVGMAFAGDAIGEYFELSQNVRVGLIAVLAYLGPRGTEAALDRWLGRKDGA